MTVILKTWPPEQWYQCLLRTCYKYKFRSPSPELLPLELRVCRASTRCFSKTLEGLPCTLKFRTAPLVNVCRVSLLALLVFTSGFHLFLKFNLSFSTANHQIFKLENIFSHFMPFR